MSDKYRLFLATDGSQASKNAFKVNNFDKSKV